ncbi:hypothetical protein N7448_001836 [Penicillium atrosanguineum]|uniref:Allergen Asp f 15 n=1 Tax=Penicillium atrosanguineum TaxID=1132637 RepID=A0A9W9HJF7_9EURO|nr:uncharacterized protein N7443_005234 [Penicillium atrosanguineum]KAJ5133134.1 hypothetical protein N7526_004499 [Penicillium atrosanguineum]KAJ5150258.1 hypothetical protein N7448_001836 [Penicillium atrosanguineum]KAJ5305574.1 hypothetical protein N7443_005234 [Penicillium atrosanguineum]KAJ5325036.1 hypothetical protein N7476_003636 [Penicillium atrosanguineum]
MKTFSAITCSILATLHLAGAAPATTAVEVSVSYDQKYDVGSSSLNTVSCSDGTYGLESKYHTFGGLPNFPLIGGSPTVSGWGSSNCGQCYQLHYQAGDVDKTINILAIDAAPGGFNIGLEAFNQLTDNQGVALGRVTATYTLIENSACGIKA